MGDIEQLTSPPADSAASRPIDSGVLIGFISANAPATATCGRVLRKPGTAGLDALILPGQSEVTVKADDIRDRRAAILLAPPVRFHSRMDLGATLNQLAEAARRQFDRMSGSAEYRIAIFGRCSSNPDISACPSHGDGRSAMRILAALNEFSQESRATPAELRIQDDDRLVLALSLLVHNGISARFLAKAQSMASFARLSGMRLGVSGPHMCETFTLRHDMDQRFTEDIQQQA